MRIGIDASRAVRERPTGTELYSARLIQHLAKIDTKNTYYLYTPTAPPSFLRDLPANFHWKIIPFPRLWSHVRLSLALWLDKPDVVFIPAHVIPLYVPGSVIVTIHDLAFDTFPEAYDFLERWYQRFAVKRAVRKAVSIITPSQATKRDIIRLYGAKPNAIRAIPHGVDDTSKESADIPSIVKKLRPFFLVIGRLEKRKNVTRIIEAFGRLKKADPSLGTKLVLIGKPGYGYHDITTAKQALPVKIAADIIELGYVEAIEPYMKAADTFLYPSLYEGFGLPLLEAMMAGTPIITSNISSMPEVVDDAAILVNPESIDELCEAMKILSTSDLSGKQISRRGRERVKEFTWKKTATETLKVLERVGRKN